jgi:hypothetical protein
MIYVFSSRRLLAVAAAAAVGMALLGTVVQAAEPQTASTSTDPAPTTTQAAPVLVPAGVVGFGWG